jgi:hypothetical protein
MQLGSERIKPTERKRNEQALDNEDKEWTQKISRGTAHHSLPALEPDEEDS